MNGSCPSLEKCPFFNDKMANMPNMSAILKKNYCLGTYSDCARYQVMKKRGKDSVPGDLYPSQSERVSALITNRL